MPDVSALAASTDLTTVGTVVTQIITWMTTMLTTIASEPLLLLGIAMFIVGGVIGLARRLIRGR